MCSSLLTVVLASAWSVKLLYLKAAQYAVEGVSYKLLLHFLWMNSHHIRIDAARSHDIYPNWDAGPLFGCRFAQSSDGSLRSRINAHFVRKKLKKKIYM